MIYVDLECLLEKMDSCKSNFKKSYTEKKIKHMASGYSLFTNCSFDAAKDKLDCYRGKDMQKVCNICKKDLVFIMTKSIIKHHCHYKGKFRGAVHSICNLRCETTKEIPIVFLNGSTYDYHFIINKLAKEFDGQLECLGETTEKCITFSVPISKELDNGKTITYKLKFIDSFRFMSTSLSSLVDNLSEI